MLASLPVHRAVTTLALAHHQAQLRITLSELGQILTAFPLGGNTCHTPKAIDDFLDIVQAVGVERANPQLHLRMHLMERWSQVVVVEAQRALGCPCTTRVRRVAIRLVLIHHLRDGQALLGIEVDETAEHVGIAL